MKRLVKYIMLIICLITFNTKIYALCDNKELNDWAENAEFRFEILESDTIYENYLGEEVLIEEPSASYFLVLDPYRENLRIVVRHNLSNEELIASYDNFFGSYVFGSYIHFDNKTYTIDIYASKDSKVCAGEKLKTITYTVPKYNMNAQTAYCQNMSDGGCREYLDVNNIKCSINCDVDNDGIIDINIDINNDGKADVNLDTDGDFLPDLNIDINNDNKADVNIDINRDNKADVNIDNNFDRLPDLNIDYNGDKKPYYNLDTDGDGIADKNLINQDSNEDGICDKNCDENNDGFPDSKIPLSKIIISAIIEYGIFIIIPILVISFIYIIKFRKLKKQEV